MRENTPIPARVVDEALAQCKIENVAAASIREIVKLVGLIEQASGKRFIRMEMGVPGLPASEVGVKAEIEALRRGVASVYPSIEGIPVLKQEASRFLQSFLDVKLSAEGCVPTVGSMQGGLAVFMTLSRTDARKTTTLFIDPGFPVQKQQHKILGVPFESFDVYEYRGEKLRAKLEGYLSQGHISSILYSSPNNPSWICLTPKELQIIAELADKYDVVVLEDQAYFGMDFRTDYSRPGTAPYPPSVAHYTDRYILLFSASKIFSYAGQRIGFLAISDALYHRGYPDLKRNFASSVLGHALVYGALYGISSGTSHSSQYAVAA
ncbi:MAG: aminotransferase class I/II-fold pyridoxal phosphate-dependent enzyme, partial [Bacteroidales bacterium]